MVAGQLLEFALAEQVGARVARMDDVQVGGDAIGHRQGGPHALEGGIAPGRLITVRSARLRLWRSSARSAVLVVAAQVEEPFERVQDERLDAPDRQVAGAFAGRGAPQAIGDDHEVPLFLGELRLAFSGQAGLAHLHGLGEPGDQEMIPRCCRGLCRCRSRHRT